MKLLEWIAHALRWLLETAVVPVVLIVALLLTMLFVFGTAVTDNKNNPNSTENKFKVACQAVNGAAVWNGKNWECIK